MIFKSNVWRLVLLASAAAAVMVTLFDLNTPLRPWLAFWFLFACPGIALVRVLRYTEDLIAIGIALAFSLGVNMLAGLVMVYTPIWRPDFTITGLALLVFTLVLAEMLGIGRAEIPTTLDPEEDEEPEPEPIDFTPTFPSDGMLPADSEGLDSRDALRRAPLLRKNARPAGPPPIVPTTPEPLPPYPGEAFINNLIAKYQARRRPPFDYTPTYPSDGTRPADSEGLDGYNALRRQSLLRNDHRPNNSQPHINQRNNK